MTASIRYLGFIVCFLTVVAGLSACTDGEIGVATTNSTVISGVASKGPLNGSTVCAYAIAAGAKGAALGSCATNIVNGNYSIDIGAYTGPVLFEATGGTYTDEATGATAALASPLRSILSNATGSAASVAVTALTELAYQMANAVPGGLTSANIQTAIASVQTNFGVADIINTLPVDALNVPSGASPAQKTYALALATISQYQKNQPAGTSVANSLQIIQACLAASTNCGTGATRVGVNLSEALNTFQAAHPAFSNMSSPVLNFGYQPIVNASDFPVNEPYATALIGKGIPEPFARFFAAAKRTGNCTGGTTCTYLITYPNGATRNVTWTATPNQQYTPTAGELASMALINENEPVYDGKFSATGLEHNSTTDAQINVSFFVPITSISKSPSSMVQKLPLTRRAIPSNALCCGVGGYQGGVYEGIQIKLKDMQAKGVDATASIHALAEYAGKTLGAKALERWGSGLGSIHKVAGLLNDSAEAMKMYQETKAWLDELAALEECAKNPTNSLTQTDLDYSANTVANLQETRARIEANGITRILNQVDETAVGIALDLAGAGAAGLITIPMKQGHIYIEETMKALSEQEMKMARDSVVSCVPACPTNLVATGVSESQINLSWSGSLAYASTSTAVTGYKVRRDGAYVGSPFVTSYSDTGLKPSTMYCYMVLAYNDYGSSGDCAQACARTLGPPTVYATSPVNNATNVAVSSPITATFSEAMDATTISTGTFTIAGVAGTVTYSGTTATFTPSAELKPLTTYTATITTGVKDVDGSAMKADYTWSFTTGGNIDGNLKFVLTGDRGQSTKGNADITWNRRSDSNSALTAYWPTGTITLDIAREGCDTVHVTKPISSTNVVDTPNDTRDDGGGLAVYSSTSMFFPGTYWFWLHTDEWEQTFYCGTDKKPYTTKSYSVWLAVKPCEKMVMGSGFIPYTDAARLADTLSCGTLTGVSMSGNLVVTWDFKNLK